MATTIGTAYVQILPSTEGIKENLTNALTGASGEAGSKSGKSFGGSFAKALGTGAAAVGTAAVATVGAVVNTTKAVAEAGDAIDKNSQKMGVSASEYQTMAFAAEHCGFEISTLQTAARNLGNTDFSGSIFDAVDAVQAIEDPLERAAYAEELFGDRAAQQMAALINGDMSMAEYQSQLESLGGMMSDTAVKDAAAFEDSLTNMSTAFEGLKMSLAGEFMPALTDVMDGVSMLMSGNMDGAEKVSKGVMSFLQGIINALPNIIEAAGSIIGQLATSLIDNLPEIIQVGMQVILQLAQGLGEALPELIPAIIDCILMIVDTLLEPNNISMLVTAAFQLIGGIAMGVIKAIPKIVEAIPQLIGSLISAIGAFFGSFKENGLELINNMWQGIQDAFGPLYEKVSNFVQQKIIQPIKSKFASIKSIGGNLITGLWNGINDKVGWIVEKIKGFGASILEALEKVFNEHSPSKETERIGRYLAMGLGIGWDKEIDAVMDDITSGLDLASDSQVVGKTVVNLTVTDPSPAYMDYLFDQFNVKLAGVV